MQFLRAASLLLTLALMTSALPSYAQMLGPEPLTVSLFPEYPRPYDTISIQPGSTLINLAASKVTISVNGEVIEEDSGTRPVEYRLGGPGTAANIRVVATDSAGDTYVKEFTIRPADVALIIDASSTAHPLYAGARLVAPEGRVRLIAVPDLRTSSGAALNPATLIYNWQHGNRALVEQSGTGRSVLDATAPVRHRDARISLTVTSPDRSIVASASIIVTPVDPVVRVYRTGPLLGPRYEEAIGNTAQMTGTEETFRVVPYFFRSTPAIAWTVNNVAGESNRDLTVRVTEPGAGSARVGVLASLPGLFQRAEDLFTLTYGGNTGGGIFGL